MADSIDKEKAIRGIVSSAVKSYANGNMLESMAISIAELNYEVSQHVEGTLYKEQNDYIAELLECYKNAKGTNHEKLWNKICDDKKGYYIVTNEISKHMPIMLY